MSALAATRLENVSPESSWIRFRSLTILTVLWVFILTTFAQFRVRHAEELWEAGGMDSQVYYQAGAWVCLGLLSLIFMFTRRTELSLLRMPSIVCYVLFILVCIVSTVLSQVPSLTLFRSGQQAVALVLVLSMRDQFKHVYFLLAIYCLINWLLAIMVNVGLDFNQEWLRGMDDVYMINSGYREEPYRFATAFGHPSIIGVVAAIGGAGLFARTPRKKMLSALPMLCLFGLTTLATVSRTAIAGFVGGVLLAAVGKRMVMTLILIGGCLLPVAFLQQGVREKAFEFISRGQDSDELASLTGRDVIWNAAKKRLQASFPLGEGFQGGRAELLDDEGSWVGITHAHNLVLESLIGLGVHGMLCAISILVFVSITVWKCLMLNWESDADYHPAGWELAATMMPVFAFCILDRGFVAEMNPFCLCFMFIVCYAERTWATLQVTTDQKDERDEIGGEPEPLGHRKTESRLLKNRRKQPRPRLGPEPG